MWVLHRCTKGKHSSEKPVAKAAPSPNGKPMQMAKTGDPALDSAKAACGRCRQGFFCSDHGLSLLLQFVYLSFSQHFEIEVLSSN
jgi:hypothetical protein